VVDCKPEQQVDTILNITGQRGAHVTVDAVGHSAVIKSCVRVTREFGEILLLGSPREAYQGDLTSIFWDVHLHGKVIRGAHMHRYPVKEYRGSVMDVDWAFQTVFQFLKSKELDSKNFISHIIEPKEAPAAYEGLKNSPNEYLGVVIDWRNGENH
jgi:threonine dehydrogenase-like Zn-dependent dehydrogenase